jgi:hypothetical protein
MKRVVARVLFFIFCPKQIFDKRGVLIFHGKTRPCALRRVPAATAEVSIRQDNSQARVVAQHESAPTTFSSACFVAKTKDDG